MQVTLPSPSQHLSPEPPRRISTGGVNIYPAERVASILAGGALTLYGIRTHTGRVPTLLAGGYCLYRGLSGHCPLYGMVGVNSDGAAATPTHLEHTVTIAVEPPVLYRLWRDFSNLPQFMQHLQEVQILDAQRSRWTTRAPGGGTVQWEAAIFFERPNEVIAWRSLPEAQIANAGSVRFTPAPAGRGTEVKVVIEYLPPAGALGRAVARIFGEEPGRQVRDDLRRLKMLLETGEAATNAMQPAL